jgi:hypothetical protein
MEDTSEETRADIKTRWKKGQSGNSKDHSLPDAGVYVGLTAGRSAGNFAGPKSPAPESQAIDFAGDFGSQKFSRKYPPADADREGKIAMRNLDLDPSPPRVGEVSRAR